MSTTQKPHTLHIELKGLQRYIFRSQREKSMVGAISRLRIAPPPAVMKLMNWPGRKTTF